MEVIDTRNGLMLRKLEEHHDHEHEESLDPHIWTSPVLVQQILHTISNALSGHMPEHKQEFENNRQKYQQELTRLDNEIRELLQPLASKPFLVFHPGWGYFADTYHLVQIVVEQEGKEPGAHSLAKLIEQAKQQNIRIVFVQPQFSRQLARQLAHAIDGDVISIDPLADDYVNNLRQVARQLAATLQ
jgi:zinc transport system substrate-binding protein